MKNVELTINGIPAILWGESTNGVFVAVHGKMSHKSDTVIEILARQAAQKGYQTLSFDLPGHGERKDMPFKIQSCADDLSSIITYVRQLWNWVGLFGCSVGAYCGLTTCSYQPLNQSLFLSPVVDMMGLVEEMMAAFAVTPALLKEHGEIVAGGGQSLYWDDYCYIKSHLIRRWKVPTAILRGEKDELCPKESVEAFARRFRCQLTTVPGGEHFFHTPEQLVAYESWLAQQIKPAKN